MILIYHQGSNQSFTYIGGKVMAVSIILLLTFERKCSCCGIRKIFTDFHNDCSRLIRSWCKSCCSKYDTEWRDKTSKNIQNRIYMREYHKRPEVRMRYKSSERLAWRKQYYQSLKDNPRFKLKNAMRAAFRHALINKKTYSTFEVLGYSVFDLMRHLEDLFQFGMSWSNYGKGGWEIDHIIPLSRFNCLLMIPNSKNVGR